MKALATCPSPLGPLTLAAQNGALAGLWIAGQKYELAGDWRDAATDAAAAPFAAARAWLDAYFAGRRPDPRALPLAPQGTPFQQAVWALLLEIPYGQTTTYGVLARRLNSSARAVGSAVGRNPISIIIPCHRVLGARGQLTGYAGGIDKKMRLLALEGVDTRRLLCYDIGEKTQGGQ